MNTPDSARRYLKQFFAERRIPLKHASRLAGHSDAYFQQYLNLKKPKPLWLSEQDREFLVDAYGVDGEQLRPPPPDVQLPAAKLASPGGIQKPGEINAPDYGQFPNDPSTLELLELWRRLRDPRNRALAKRILRLLIGGE